MTALETILTSNEAIRFVVYEREDGMFRIDEETSKEGDEYTGPYWSHDQVGLFGSRADVASYLEGVTPKPLNNPFD